MANLEVDLKDKTPEQAREALNQAGERLHRQTRSAIWQASFLTAFFITGRVEFLYAAAVFIGSKLVICLAAAVVLNAGMKALDKQDKGGK